MTYKIVNQRKTKNKMHKQLKQILVQFSRKRVLLFVLIFSMALLDSGIYRFAKQNNWLEDEFAKQIQNIGLIDSINKDT